MRLAGRIYIVSRAKIRAKKCKFFHPDRPALNMLTCPHARQLREHETGLYQGHRRLTRAYPGHQSEFRAAAAPIPQKSAASRPLQLGKENTVIRTHIGV